jgi:acetylornithine aminotransferase
MLEGFEFFSYNDLESFEQLLNQLEAQGPRVAAVLIEPLQGEGGVIPGDPAFFQGIRDLCSERQILLIFDEVQVGMGRTGHWWGYQQLGVEPDAFTLAKGLGGGHAVGALLVKQKADLFEPGDHASTFGGNPFACKAALTVATEIERRELLLNVQQQGDQLRAGLSNLVQGFPKQLKEARGWGLLQGLVIQEQSPITASNIVLAALDQQLLLVAAGPKVVRMVPPLVIQSGEIRQLLKQLEAAIKSCI